MPCFVSAQMSMKREGDGILITEGDQKVAFYAKEAPAMNLDKGRANYFHPVYLPDGTVITENAPEDHIHHRGIFWAWHQILIDGTSIGDQWTLSDFIHDVKSVEFFRLPQGMAMMKTIVHWKSPKYAAGARPFVEEKATVSFFEQRRNYRIIQFRIQLRSQVNGLMLGGSDDSKGYGGFSARIDLPDDVRFSSEGKEVEPQKNAVQAGKYMTVSGSMAKNGHHGGVLIYSANSFDTSKQWILRNKESMQNAVWPGREPVALSKVTPLVLKYAVVLYTGRLNEKRVLKDLQKLEWD